MSQKSSPRSPKSPVSKSPSCDEIPEEGQENVSPGNLRQAVEEKFGSSDRVASRHSSAGNRGIPGSQASRLHNQGSPHGSPPRGSPPRGSPPRGSTRGISTLDEEVLGLPSPPASPFSPQAPSQRASRGPPSSHASARALRENMPYSAAASYSTTRDGRSTVNFRNSNEVSYQRGQNSSPGYARGYGGSSVPGIATSYSRVGFQGVDTGTSGLGLGAAWADAATSNMMFGAQGIDRATSNMFGMQGIDATTSNMFGMQGIDATTSQMFGMQGIDAATSNMMFGARGIDTGVSAMSYNIPRGQFAQTGGRGCGGGYQRFMPENQGASYQPGLKQMPPYGQTMGGRTSPLSDRYMGGPGQEPNGPRREQRPVSAGPNFNRGASPSRSGYEQPSHHHHHSEGPDEFPQRDEKVMAALGHLSQLKKTPSYFRCGLNQGLDFLKVCCPKANEPPKTGKIAKFPEIPCLRQDEIDDLIKCESQDVESAWFLTSEDKKTYKKPCPKQQKAQMTVKALIQAHTNQTCSSSKEYTPLEHPDPEDISPEVAAAMMFSQERGIKMDECPHYTITSLFPDEPKAPFPEKIPQSSISIVDRSSKDNEEMMEKSVIVPSEGVSDSAYTRTMKEKGEDMGPQRSFDVDFAIGQSKREYVLVAQKPQRVNKVQYRGATSTWFPGYFSAFPDDEGLKVVSSPSGLFHKAWVHSNPGNMQTSDVIVLD